MNNSHPAAVDPDKAELPVLPRSNWLPDRRAALILTFDIDGESCVLAEGRHFAERPNTMSHQAFGPLVGTPRILEMLQALDIRATFFVPGVIAEWYPDLIRRVRDEGHEIGHHSYSHRAPRQLSEQEERQDFERALEVFDRLDVAPRGHRSALWATKWTTAGLVAEFGLRYESNQMDDDRPYLLETDCGTIAEIPPHSSWDDFPQYAYMSEPYFGHTVVPPSTALRVWLEELDALREYAGALVLTAHPFLSGRAGRVAAIRRLVEQAREWGDVAILTADEAAELIFADPAAMHRKHEPRHIDETVYPH
jgi:peptidoglycan/xylan/chitin deacetylase (PgdA/CDA1 family)